MEKRCEVKDNIVITKSILDMDILIDPKECLEGLESFSKRYVGGLHNLSHNDKWAWVRNNGKPLRVIETNTGREEVWFLKRNFHPIYISIDGDGKVTSHQRFNSYLPAVYLPSENMGANITQPLYFNHSHTPSQHIKVWFQNDQPTTLERGAAVTARTMILKIKDSNVDYIDSIKVDVLAEDWCEGTWKQTRLNSIELFFKNTKLNTPDVQEKALDWIGKNCKNGFFPFEETLFGSKEEEFMFVADFCS